jgi:hypothetical protein
MKDKFRSFTQTAIKSVSEFPTIKTTTKNFKAAFTPTAKISKLHLAAAEGVSPSYDKRIDGEQSKFEQDKSKLSQGKTHSDFKQTTIVAKASHDSITDKVCSTIKANARGIKTRKEEYKQYKSHVDSCVSDEQKFKKQHIDDLNKAFAGYLHNTNPELEQHFNKYQEAKKDIDTTFDLITSHKTSQLDKAIAFQEFISDLTKIIITDNKDDKTNFASLVEQYPEFAPNIQHTEYSAGFKKDALELLENRKLYLSYDNDKSTHEINSLKSSFMETDVAKKINQEFIDNTTPLYATILQSNYKHIYHDSMRSLRDTLQYAGVDVKKEGATLPRSNHIINKGLMPIDVITKGVSLSYGLISGKDKYYNARDINKQTRFLDSAQQLHMLSWTHSSDVSKQTLVIQQQMERLSETLQNKFKQDPFINDLDETSQSKIEALETKQNLSIQTSVKSTIADLQAHINKLDNIIDNHNNNKSNDNSHSLKDYRNNLAFETDIKRQITLINKSANLCLDKLAKIQNQAELYRPKLAGDVFTKELSQFQENLNILSSIKNTKDIPQELYIGLKSINPNDIDSNKYAVNPLKAEQLHQSNIAYINKAIQNSEKEEIKDIVSQLYGNNNSKNFKIALDTYMRKIDELIGTHLRNVSAKDVSDNLPNLQHWGSLNRAGLHTQLQATNANLHVQSGMKKAGQFVDDTFDKANTKIDELFSKKSNAESEGELEAEADDNRAKTIALNASKDVGKGIAKTGNVIAYGIAKTGVITADIATKSIARTPEMLHFAKDSVINTAQSTVWAAREMGERHLFGLAYPVKGLARLADKANIILPAVTPLARKLYQLDHHTQDNHTNKTKYGSMRGMVRFKQRERRSEGIADSLEEKIQVARAINKAEEKSKNYDVTDENAIKSDKPTITNPENIDNLFNYLRQGTRHMYTNTNVTGFAKDRLFIEDMYSDTLAKKISSYMHEKLHLGTTDAQKEQALKSFLQSYAGGKYLNSETGKVNVNDPAMLQAWKTTVQNTDAQAKFIAKTILGLYIPFKLGSNYLGVVLYTKTGNPVILFINAPGNPIDDVMVGATSAIIASVSSLLANVFTKEFDTNKQDLITKVDKALYHNDLSEKQNPNAKSDNIISLLTQGATAGLADGSRGIELPENFGDAKVVGYDEFIATLTQQVADKVEMNAEEKQKLQSLIDAIDINQTNKNSQTIGASPTKQDDLPDVVQGVNQAIANIPFLNDIRPRTKEEVETQTTTLKQNVSFADQVKSPVLDELSEMYYSMMDRYASTLVAPATIATTAAAGLAYTAISTAADSVQAAGQLITKKDVKSTWGNSMTECIKKGYHSLGRFYENISNQADNHEERKGIPAAKLNEKTGFSAKPRMFAAS